MHQNSASFSLSINWFLRLFAVVFIQIVAVCIFEYTRWIRVYFYFLIVKSVFEFKQSTFYDVILGVTGVTEGGALFSRNYYVHARVCRTIVRTTCSLLSVLHYLVPTLLQSLYNCASCNWLVGIPFESSQSIVLLLQHFARVQSARTAHWTTIYNTKNLTTYIIECPKIQNTAVVVDLSSKFLLLLETIGLPLGVCQCQWYCPACVVKGSTVV